MPRADVRAALLVVFGLPIVGLTQSNQTKDLLFDVASIKESDSLDLDGVFRITPGRFTVTNLSLRWIVRFAFRLRDYQVIGAPAWTETRYQIDARFSHSAAADDDVRAMLRRLLIDRFALRAHPERRDMRVYALTRSRPDNSLGPKLTPSTIDCSRPEAERVAQLPAPAGKRPTCAAFQTHWFIRGFSRTMPFLAQTLDATIGSPVIDRTGLAGNFDFDVQWGTPSDSLRDPSIQTPEDIAALFTALPEQLGLKLESSREPYDVLVIDSVSRPTPD
jgi:uncharacterized protein (TIGR03435 family)